MGSVKDLHELKKASESYQGIFDFEFSDRYSIFDWGEMPDHLKSKGNALAIMSAFNFEELSKRGINHHYLNLMDNTYPILTSELNEKGNGTNIMRVKSAVRYNPIERRFGINDKPFITYDYSFFNQNRGQINNFVIPLEIIFRNGLPKGSSVFKQLKKAQDPTDDSKLRNILSKLGLSKIPEENSMLPNPVIEYTTKFEASDRPLTEEGAYQISGLPRNVFSEIKDLALKVNDYINERAEKTGLTPHWDGKVEMVYFNGNLLIVDVFGTLDENRFGGRISKEFLRQWYMDFDPTWYKTCEELKDTGEGWQSRVIEKFRGPKKLPDELSKLVSQMYMSACNQWVQREIFPKVPDLEIVLSRLSSFRD